MEENKGVQLFTQENDAYCGCFPWETYKPVEGEYVKKDEKYDQLLALKDKAQEIQEERDKFNKYKQDELLALKNKEKAFQEERDKFNKDKEQEISLINGKGNEIYKEKVKLDKEKEQFEQEKGNYIKRGEATFNDLSQETQKNYVKKGEATFNDLKNKDIYIEKPKNFDKMQKFYNEKGDYVKRGEAKFYDLSQVLQERYTEIYRQNLQLEGLSEDKKRKLAEDAFLDGKVDGSDITWRTLFDKLDIDFSIMKFWYLLKIDKFAELHRLYNSKEQLNSLQEGKIPDGIDTIRTQDGDEIQLSNELIAKIKSAEGHSIPYVDLYDAKNDSKNKLFYNNPNISLDLSKINDYKVALVIPDALLNK